MKITGQSKEQRIKLGRSERKLKIVAVVVSLLFAVADAVSYDFCSVQCHERQFENL